MAKSRRMPKSTDDRLTGVYDWLGRQSNSDPLGVLISEIQKNHPEAKNEITKTGTKEHRLRMLRRAVSLGIIPIERIYQLLYEAEETGQQRVYLFRPTGLSKSLLLDGAEVASRLFEDQWGEDYFPNFEIPENDYVWADFRLGLKGYPKDWILKAYGHELLKRTTKTTETEEIGDNEFREVREYKLVPTYTVNVIRWRAAGFLEVRIDKENAPDAKEGAQRFSTLTEMFNPVLDLNRLSHYKLSSKCLQFWNERKDKRGRLNREFTIGQVLLNDSDKGNVKFVPNPHGAADFDSNIGRSKSLDELLADGATPVESKITLKFEAKEVAKFGMDALPIVIGGGLWNEISIAKRVNPELYEYVISKFCEA